MAKGSTTANKKQTTAVANKPKNEVTDVSLLMEQDAGMGVSSDMADNIVPLVYILQAQSPQVLKQKPEFLRDAHGKGKPAVAGNLWLRGEKTAWDGEEDGVEFVPIHFDKCWIEWRPNRGGFVARHKERPAEAVQKALDPQKPDRMSWVLPSGNIVQESREHVGFILGVTDTPIACVVPMTGSNHTASRAFMGLMNRKLTPKGAVAPSFSHKYLLKTIAKSNDDGDWFGYVLEDTGEMVDPEVYLAARNIAKSFQTGAMRAADHDSGVAGEENSDDGI